jgi:hypothetical protein
MSSVRYILAKHIPNVFRKEPQNIGVIVWSEFGVAAQFWGVDAYGILDKRQVPPFIISASAYQQWVTFWLSEIQKPQVEFIGSSKFTTVQSPDFVEAIQTGNSENFFLQEAGVVLEPLTKGELPALVRELFESLVTSGAIDEPDTAALVKTECDKIMKSSRLYGNKHFERGKKVFPTIGTGASQKVLKNIEFSYSYGNGAPKWLGQQVALKRYPSQLKKEVQSVCYSFERVFENDFITQEYATTFIYPMDDQIGNEDVDEAIATLSVYTQVVNLRDQELARRELDKVASIPLNHD